MIPKNPISLGWALFYICEHFLFIVAVNLLLIKKSGRETKLMLILKKNNKLMRTSFFSVVLFFNLLTSMVATMPVFSEDTFSNVALIGRVPLGIPRNFAMDNESSNTGNHLYIMDRIGIRIVDVSDPVAPSQQWDFFTHQVLLRRLVFHKIMHTLPNGIQVLE